MAEAADWRTLRAQKYEAAKQEQGSAAGAARRRRDSAGIARAASRLRAVLPPAAANPATWVLAVLVVSLVAPMVVERVQRATTPWRCADAATRRPAHTHRAHILQQAGDTFVRVFSACQLGRASVSGSRQAELQPDADLGLRKTDGERWSADFDYRHGGITRCATSQYAVVTYLCGKAVADLDGKQPGFQTPRHLMWFLDSLDHVVQTGSSDSCSQWPELVLRFNVHEATDPSLGHTFAVHFLPEGGMQVYQSFITHYTLHSYLESHGPLDLSGFKEFLHNIEVITNVTGSTWPAAAERAYRTNFLVSLARGGKILLGQSADEVAKPWLRRSKASDLQQHRPIAMLAETACLAAPWQGGPAASDASLADPHAAWVRAVLPPFFGDAKAAVVEEAAAAVEQEEQEEEDGDAE